MKISKHFMVDLKEGVRTVWQYQMDFCHLSQHTSFQLMFIVGVESVLLTGNNTTRI